MKKQISFLIITGLLFSALFNTSAALAAEPVLSGFNPDKLIDDKVFSNEDTMNASDIQDFLEDKNSVLANTSNAFISQLREPSNAMLKQTLEDPNPNLTKLRTAAELIYDASQSSGLNPQVILVKLNKEQSLITGRQNATPEQLQRALDFSLGFGCPDSQPCGEIYKGFYFQLFGGVDSENNRYLGAAKSLMKSFSTPGGRGPFFNGKTSQVGDVITLGNTVGNYEGVMPQQTVTLSNAATAALYRYTPHVYNGNYNFWRFFNMWFSSSSSDKDDDDDDDLSGDLVKSSTSGDVYIIENNGKYRVLKFVAEARKLRLSKAKKISKSKLASFPDNGLYAVPDNTLVKVDDKYYIFEFGQKRLITEADITAKGLRTRDAIETDSKEADMFPTGAVLSMQDGAVLKGANSPAVYLVTGGKLKLFTYATFLQYDAAKSMQIVPEETIAKYAKDGLVLPKPGSLVKSFDSQTVYFYEDGKKKPMDAEIFRNRGFSFSNVYELDQAEIDALPLGNFPDPVNNTFFQDKKTGQQYVYRDGKKSAISAFVAKQKGITPDFSFGEDSIKNMPNGTPVMPAEGTVLKSDKAPDVYIMNAGLIFPMTYEAFVARGITAAQVNILPQAEVDSYPKGSVLTK